MQKITIILGNEPPKTSGPRSREEKVAALLKKIEYAADCIEYDSCKEQAIAFLQETYKQLSMHRRMRDDTQMLMEKCFQVIKDYGTLPIMPKDSEESEG